MRISLSRKRLMTGIVILVALGASILYAAGRRRVYSPVQPIAFSHRIHGSKLKIGCAFCHENGEGRSPHMLIPSAEKCALCHQKVKRDSPEVQKILNHAKAKTEPEWKRVYGFSRSASVFFDHVPHIDAKISCETCHGNVEDMFPVGRVVDQTMGWCLKCHQQTPDHQVLIPNTKTTVNSLMGCAVCHR